MLRGSIILATIVALLVGSFGLPVSLYACGMKAKAPACGLCGCSAERGGAAVKRASGKGAHAKPCCEKKQSVLRDDVARTMPQSLQLCAQLAAAVIVYSYAAADLSAPPPEAEFLLHHPPPLEHHAQATYLFNSTFLI